MKIPRVIDSRLGYLSAAFLMLTSIAAPGLLTASASAAVVTSRSIALSSAVPSATGVDYELTFTPGTNAGATVLVFCSDSPIIGETCTAPTGLDVSSVTSDVGTAAEFETQNNAILFTHSITASTPVTVTFGGIVNPSSAGALYARLLTYTDASTAGTQYTSATSVGTYIDEGGFAMSITDPINVSAAVRETMTFCVSAASISANCADVTTPPDLSLGEGDPKALSTSTTSTGNIYTQISTNASAGAVIKMKNNNECGGLRRQGAASTVCSIAPIATGTAAIGSGDAKFGMKVTEGSVTTGGITAAANYASATDYGFNFDDNDVTGVTSPYGDEVYDTDGAPVDNANATLNFAARANNTTPAGKYQAALSLIATGTF